MGYAGPGRGHEDPYQVLGVDTRASRQDIARAYRRAVHGAHPDSQPDDPQATVRFRALTDAYDLLSDPRRRAEYDRQHPPQLLVTTERWPGRPFLAPAPYGHPVWAGPVHIKPPTARASLQDGGSAPATDFEDPPVILGMPGLRGRWPW